MKTFNYRKYLPHAVAIAVFAALTLSFFSPVLQGYELKQHDVDTYRGMSKEIRDYRKEFKDETLWTNALFGGMPAYQVDINHNANLLVKLDRLAMLGIPGVIGYAFLLFVGFYILLLCFKVNPWLAIAGAAAYAFSTYFILIIAAGHNTKVHALAYMPAVLGSFMLLLRDKRTWLATALFTLFLGMEIMSNHFQITYYMAILLLVAGLGELLLRIANKGDVTGFFKRIPYLALGVVLAVSVNLANLWGTYNYSKETTRGPSELTITPTGETKQAEKGLESGYITAWSYGRGETFTLAVPNANGGASGALIADNEFMDDRSISMELKGFVYSEYEKYSNSRGREGMLVSPYWGDQPFTGGPTYTGMLIIFLFVLGLVFVRDPLKWALLAATVLVVFLAWGLSSPGATIGIGLPFWILTLVFVRNRREALTWAGIGIPALALIVLLSTYLPNLARYFVWFSACWILALLFIRSRRSGVIWAVLAVPILALLPFMDLTSFFINYVPGYNKFRVVAMILTVAQLTLPFLGILYIKQLWDDKPEETRSKQKLFFIVSGIFSAAVLLLIAVPEQFLSFLSERENRFFAEKAIDPAYAGIGKVEADLIAYRIGVFRADAFRSFVFVLAGIAALALFMRGTFQKGVLVATLGLLMLFDLWGVNRRYLKVEKEKGEYAQWQKKGTPPYLSSAADRAIFEAEAALNPEIAQKAEQRLAVIQQEIRGKRQLAQQDVDEAMFPTLNLATDYRVLAVGDPFNNAGTSYFHKSVGGYHGAKLKRYQELIEFNLMHEHNLLLGMINRVLSIPELRPEQLSEAFAASGVFAHTPVLNMLNTRYIILNGELPPVVNPLALGSAWFVKEVNMVENANEEISGLAELDPAHTALVDKRFEADVKFKGSFADSTASIVQRSYLPNQLVYESRSAQPGFVVFSEIYYAEGWNAYIDGQLVPHVRANYVLRGLDVPAGTHAIEFRFEPEDFFLARKVGLIMNGVFLLLVAGMFFLAWRQSKSNAPAA